MPRRKKTSHIPTLVCHRWRDSSAHCSNSCGDKECSCYSYTACCHPAGRRCPIRELQRVSLADAETALDSGTAVFVDVRGADVYAMSHIPGALSIPLAEIEMRLNELDPAQWIITYCT